MSLLPHHQRLISDSAISDAVADERGYWSAETPGELARWFGPTQRRLVPALVIPVYSVRGELKLVQLRPDEPRVVKGKVRKYEFASGCRMVLDVPPRVRGVLADPTVPLLVTEGSRKVDSAVTAGLHAIAVQGVTTWRGKNEHGGKTALPDHELIAWNGRIVYLAFDSDAMVKREVYEALKRYSAFLARLDAEVRIVYLPSGEAGAKVGVDDYLAAGHHQHELLELASDQLLEPGAPRRRSTTAPEVRLRRTYELAGEIGHVLDRFVVLPSRAAALTISLFVLHSWAFDAAFATPYLVLQSPVKRSGKSRVEEVLELLVRAPWRIAATSESALFRKIDQERPTLLMDEVDALFGRSESTEPVRAILNAGNRPGAAVSRVVGDGATMTVVDFSVFCPKVLAGIQTARWSDTVLDRSIVVQLRRKKPGESVERLRPRKLRAELEQLRAELGRWAAEHIDELRELEPEFVPGLDDRGFEAWEPLLAIAEIAEAEGGAGWVQNARRAALMLAGERPEEAEGERVATLAAIRTMIGESDAIHTNAILSRLNADESLPFGDSRNGRGLSGRGLGQLLKPFAISPQNVLIDGRQAKGYRRAQFVDAWARYCAVAPDCLSEPSTRPAPDNGGRFESVPIRPQRAEWTDHKTPESSATTAVRTGGRTESPDQAPMRVRPASQNGPAALAKLTHEQRMEHWRDRRKLHRRELEPGAPTLAELDSTELLSAFPGAQLEPTDVDRAAEVIACSLTGSELVLGRWWSSNPIRRGLERYGITDETVIEAALELLDVQVRTQGGTGARWRLNRVPELPRPARERTAACGCDERPSEWRHAGGGGWTCALCHPPASGLEIEHRTGTEGHR